VTGFANRLVDGTPMWTGLAGIVIAIAVLWFALNGRDWAPIVVIMTVPIQRSLLVSLDGRSVTWTQICLLAFLIGAACRFLNGQMSLRIDAPVSFFAITAGLIALSIVASPPLHAWARECYRWLTPLLFLVLARSFFRPQSVHRLGIALSTLAVGMLAWAIAQVVSDTGPVSFARHGHIRVSGGFGEPNPFAAFAAFCGLLLIGLAGQSRRGLRRLLFGLGGGAAVATTLMTQSRGGTVALVAGGAVLSLQGLRFATPRVRYGVFGLAGMATALLVVIVALDRPWEVAQVQVTTANWANRERMAHWLAAIGMMLDHPGLGIGAGAFDDQFRTYTADWHFRISRGHAHNAYLQVAAEAGVFALVSYLAFLGSVVATLVVRVRASDRSMIPLGVLAGTIGMATHQMFDYLNVLSLGLLFAGAWAFALAPSEQDSKYRDRSRAN